jgi:hypothetical protein
MFIDNGGARFICSCSSVSGLTQHDIASDYKNAIQNSKEEADQCAFVLHLQAGQPVLGMWTISARGEGRGGRAHAIQPGGSREQVRRRKFVTAYHP